MNLSHRRKSKPYTSPEYQRLVAANPKYQAAIDRLLVATSSNKKRTRKDKQDGLHLEDLEQSWFEYYMAAGGSFHTITYGLIPDWADDDLADEERISKGEITNEKRIEFAKGRISNNCANDKDIGFDGTKVNSTKGETAYVVFQVQIEAPQAAPAVSCFGVFRNLRAFRKQFRDDGWLDTSKISNRRILELWSKD